MLWLTLAPPLRIVRASQFENQWCTATGDCAFEWRGELVWGNRRWARLRSLQTYRTVITIMLSSRIKLKQTLNDVGNIAIYNSSGVIES